MSIKALPTKPSSVWLPFLIGGLSFLIIAGPQFLDPRNVAWLLGGDPLQHYLGWAFFRNSPWTMPLGLNPLYGMDFSNSIVFTDSIPLLAIPFKAISSFLPEPFQYFGIWVLLCFMLQALLAYRLIGLFCNHAAIKALGCIFFLFSPPLIFRLNLHESLMGHFLILSALYLNLRSLKSSKTSQPLFWQSLAWIVLLSTAVLVHFYLAVMVLGLWVADLSSRVFIQKIITFRGLGIEGILMVVVISFVAWQAGYFAIEGASGAASGFGDFRTNVLALFNSRGWSYWLRSIPLRDSVEAATGEGFQYLGAGSLLLLMSATYAAVTGRFQAIQMMKLAWKKYCFLIAAILAFALLSFSNRVGFGPWNFTIPLPDLLLNIFSIVRSSSRLFWPMYYLIILTILFIILRSYKFKIALLIISFSAILQVADTSAGWLGIRKSVAIKSSSEFQSKLQNPFWKTAASFYQNIVINDVQGNWEDFGVYASQNKMATNMTHLARVDFDKQVALSQSIGRQLYAGPINPSSIYILRDWKSAQDKASYNSIKFDPNVDLLANIDGFNLLAPGWKNCSTCPQVDESFELLQLAPSLDIGQSVAFTKSGDGRAKFLLNGWGYTEDWGTWAIEPSAKIVVPMPKGDPSILQITANAFLTPGHPEQIVDVIINGATVADHLVLSRQTNNVLEVKLPRGAKAPGEPVDIEFKSLHAISPRDAGLSADDRKLGIGLVSIQFVR